MKSVTTLISLALVFVAASSAQAQQHTIALPAVQGAIHSPFKMAYDQAREYQGQYTLENGKTLTVSRWGQRLFADVVGEKDVELIAIAPATFVTKDRLAQVAFREAANGNVFGVQLQTRATQLAQAEVTQAGDAPR